MSKEEFFNLCKQKTFVSNEELNKQYEEVLVDLKKREIPEDKLEKFALARIKTIYKKQFASSAEKFTGFIIGDMGETDFGANKKFNEVKNVFKDSNSDNKQRMISEGVVDDTGTPLWKDHAFKKGAIDPNKEKIRRLLVACKKDNESEYRLATLSLKGDKLNIKKPVLSDNALLFRANVGKDENGVYFLNSASVTEFVEDKNNKDNVIDVIKKLLKQNLVKNLSELSNFHEQNKENLNRIAVVKGNVVSISKESPFSIIINVDDDSLEMEKVVTCFLPKDYNIDFSEGALDCILIGRTSTKLDTKTNEERLNLNLYGIYVDEIWKNNVKTIKPEEIEEEEAW